jgi:hypothetical protein
MLDQRRGIPAGFVDVASVPIGNLPDIAQLIEHAARE